MENEAFGFSDVGRYREHNEDAFLIDEDMGLYVVCDGVGGHSAGEIASKLACEIVHRVVRENHATLEKYSEKADRENRTAALLLIERAVETAGREVYAAAQEDSAKRGMGTTICVLAICGEHAILAHVGDSRIYLVRRGEVHQMTEDHTLALDLHRRGRMNKSEAASHPHAQIMTRAVGYQEYVQVDTVNLELMPGDIFLLCSDGLHQYLRPNELEDCFTRLPAHVVPEMLIDVANERGGRDNITALVVQIAGSPKKSSVDAAFKMDAIRRLPLFKELSYREASKVLDICGLKTYPTGARIIREGDVGDQLYIVLTGRALVMKNGAKLAELVPGAAFGETGLVERAPRVADVFAAEPTKVLMIRQAGFFWLLRSEPLIAVKLLWALCQILNYRLRLSSANVQGVASSLRNMLSVSGIKLDDSSMVGSPIKPGRLGVMRGNAPAKRTLTGKPRPGGPPPNATNPQR